MATGTVSAVIRAHQRRLVTFAISLVFAVAALPALAQQQELTQNGLPPPYYGYGHMMWGGPGPGWGWHPFMIVGPIVAVLALIGTVVIFVWLVRWATHGFPFHHHGLHHFYGRGAALNARPSAARHIIGLVRGLIIRRSRLRQQTQPDRPIWMRRLAADTLAEDAFRAGCSQVRASALPDRPPDLCRACSRIAECPVSLWALRDCASDKASALLFGRDFPGSLAIAIFPLSDSQGGSSQSTTSSAAPRHGSQL